MRGCTNYTDEATGWHRDERGQIRPIRVILILAFIALIALMVFVVWPKMTNEGFSVATAQTASESDQKGAIQAADVGVDSGAAESSREGDGAADNKLVVYLTGAVVNPGVFELAAGARINDAIVMSGGLSEGAANNYINLAATLEDGMHIHIPTTEEIASGEAARIADSGAEGQSSDSKNAVASGEQGAVKVNINTADSKELQTLTGIGEATAKKIIDYREKNGAYKSIEDLKNVSGIGDKKFESLADSICV
jgi:competence protein ComEA